jgi:hypothetical protein
MTWANSKIFAQTVLDGMGNTAAIDLDADTLKAALYNNSITPDNTVTAANSAYNAGQWANTNEQTNGGWSAGGLALASRTWVKSSAVCTLDAADLANGTAATLSNVFGCLVYDSTLSTPVASQGICYNYFGGAQSVTSGTLTIVWNASGIMQLTLT